MFDFEANMHPWLEKPNGFSKLFLESASEEKLFTDAFAMDTIGAEISMVGNHLDSLPEIFDSGALGLSLILGLMKFWYFLR